MKTGVVGTSAAVYGINSTSAALNDSDLPLTSLNTHNVVSGKCWYFEEQRLLYNVLL